MGSRDKYGNYIRVFGKCFRILSIIFAEETLKTYSI